MTRRDLVIACVGTSLGLSGCKGMSRSGGRAAGKQLFREGGNWLRRESERIEREQERSKDSSGPKSYKSVRRLSRYPALKAYIQDLRDIPAGTFRFGFHIGQSESVPRIDVSAFRMGSTPVTWAVWKEYCDAESVKLPDVPEWGRLDKHPVVNVSYNNIVGINGVGGFCGWVRWVSGINVAPPTSEQFEYAARGGYDGLEYPWGNSFDESKVWLWGDKYTAAVDRKERIYRNRYGLTDMIGNVMQWCSSSYEDEQEVRGGPPYDLVFGGSGLTCSYRNHMHYRDKALYVGFRLVAPA